MPCVLKSFPIALNSSMIVSQSTYNTMGNTQVGLSITWGSGSDNPDFSEAASVRSGEISHTSIEKTSLRYNSKNYQLFSVQITGATHNSWLALTNSEVIRGNNIEDVILTFISTEDSVPTFILLVNPIIRVTAPIQSSAFLTAFTSRNNSTVGPDSLFPNDRSKQFVYYTTCGKDVGNQNNLEVLVVVNVQGLLVWQNIMTNILATYQRERFASSFPNYVPVFYSLFSETPTPPLTTFVGYGVSVGLGYSSSVQTPNLIREVLTDSYKCVPLNPERDISGGTLLIDSRNGTPLNTALGKRRQEIDNYNSTSTILIPYEILKKYTNIFLIAVFSILFVCILVYAILSFTMGPTLVGSGASRLNLIFTGILKTPIYVVIAFFCTFVGLIIGLTLSANSTAPIVATTVTGTATTATTPTTPATSTTPTASGTPRASGTASGTRASG